MCDWEKILGWEPSINLKKGLKFTDALRLGYEDAMREEVELTKNTLKAKDNVYTNLLL